MDMLFGRILIGTSGWDYDDWIGPFYKTERGLFSQYTRVFNTVEINSTFYSLPGKGFIEGLLRSAPRGFVFSLKMYRGITHKKLLNPKLITEELDLFFKLINQLGGSGKLGAILIQLPPRPKNDVPWFKDFLEMLPREYRFAVEFRHPSWLNDGTFKLLREHNVAYAIVDEPLLPPEAVVTADFTYIRWHGRGERPWYYYHYTEQELKEWALRINQLIGNVSLLLGYFNNHFRGFAPHNALQMLSLLGMLDRERRQLLKEMDEYFQKLPEKSASKARTAALEGNVDEVLKALAGDKRYERGLEIKDEAVTYTVAGDRVIGKVKEYDVYIDLDSRIIRHNCEDWRKSLEGKRFCKHMVKFFLVIPRDLALKILEDIITNMDDWEFVADKSEQGE